jgi:hypothetical protein
MMLKKFRASAWSVECLVDFSHFTDDHGFTWKLRLPLPRLLVPPLIQGAARFYLGRALDLEAFSLLLVEAYE